MDLIVSGQIREIDGRSTLSVPLAEVELNAPATLAQIVENQLERLSADEQALLAVASVAGVEFPAAMASADGIDPLKAEQCCQVLARRGQFLRVAGIAEWPDGTVSGRYAFVHGLYQNVLCERVPIGHRVGLHLRVAERLERGYGARAGEIASELAVHFEHGRDFERGARYRKLAAEHALQRHAYREAADNARRGLELLNPLPESLARMRDELGLQLTLGGALTAVRGFSAPEVESTYARARELCEQMQDPQLIPALLGLSRFYLVRGRLSLGGRVAAQMRSLAEASGDAASMLAAHCSSDLVALYGGDFHTAVSQLDKGIALYHPSEHHPSRSPTFRVGQDPGVTCVVHAAWGLWMLGYPARSAERMREGLALARSVGDPFSVAYANFFAVAFYQCRGEREAMQQLHGTALAQAIEHGFALWVATGTVQQGWILAARGSFHDGVAHAQKGVAILRQIGAELLLPYSLATLAELHQRIGQADAATTALDEALRCAEQSGLHYWDGELWRLKGTVAATEREAETCFMRAIEIARRQRAQSFELRAATHLSRLWTRGGRYQDARVLLSPVYEWFTEGFDSADLSAAKSVLQELTGRR